MTTATTIRCIIVDDEPAAHYVLANYINQDPFLELVHQCYNGVEALEYLQTHMADLMFLGYRHARFKRYGLAKKAKTTP
jgi:DNA-binding LytR/AlgR family response regulator